MTGDDPAAHGSSHRRAHRHGHQHRVCQGQDLRCLQHHCRCRRLSVICTKVVGCRMVLEMRAAEQDLLVWEHTETCQSKDGWRLEGTECSRVGTILIESYPSVERFTIRVSRSLVRHAWTACKTIRGTPSKPYSIRLSLDPLPESVSNTVADRNVGTRIASTPSIQKIARALSVVHVSSSYCRPEPVLKV